VPIVFHPVANELVTGTATGAIQLWDADSGQPIGEPLEMQPGVSVTSLAFSPDGTVLVAGNAEGTIAVHRWSGSGLDPSHSDWNAHIGRVRAVVFSADGDRLASGGGDGATVLWDAAEGFEMVAGMHGHSGEVRALVFGANDDTLVSGSTDQTIRIWNTRRPSDEPVVIVSVHEWIRALAISPDGQVMAAPDTEGVIRLIVPVTEALVEKVCERVTRNLPMDEWTRVVGPGVPYQSACPTLPPGDGAPGGETPTLAFAAGRVALPGSTPVGANAR
jgi:WD40 repeat protein